MNDTPIYYNLENGDDRERLKVKLNENYAKMSEPHPVGWFTDARRRWLYGVAAAALPIIGGLVGWSAVEAGNVLNLIGAVLIVGSGAVPELARRNVR